MASLKSIASDVGISYTLVSKVLSGRMGTTGVSALTRETILRRAREVNYQPNRLAVALKRGRKGAIGVFLHHTGEPSSEITDQFLRGLSSGLEEGQVRMWLRFFIRDDEFVAACDDDLRQHIDGLIVGGVAHPELMDKLARIDRGGLPIIVAVDDLTVKPEVAVTRVGADYELQSYLATRHLLEKGCTRLAHLHRIDSRYRGFARALQEVGRSVSPRHVVATGWAAEDGRRSVETLLRDGLEIDGLVCQSDAQAFGAINHLLSRGISVPDRVKVTGVDDSPLASLSPIPITSATSGMWEMGLQATGLLLRRIDGEKVESVTIAPRLVVRASSGG